METIGKIAVGMIVVVAVYAYGECRYGQGWKDGTEEAFSFEKELNKMDVSENDNK